MGVGTNETNHSKPNSPNLKDAAGFFKRMYDYTEKYSEDEPKKEFDENARVWNVYLDEAETYDADMIQGYRNIMDGLLVFVSDHKLSFTDRSQLHIRRLFSRLWSQHLWLKHLKPYNQTIHRSWYLSL